MNYYNHFEVLPYELLKELKKYAYSQRENFKNSSVVPATDAFRIAESLFSPTLPDGIIPIVIRHIERASRMLSIEIGDILDIQMTRTPNDGYLKPHIDNPVGLEHRVLAWVFYFGSVEGGELVIQSDSGPIVVKPVENSIVIFPGHLWHEVLKVSCGNSFKDGRFTVNGWAFDL